VRICILRLVPLSLVVLSLGGCLRDSYVSTSSIVRSGDWRIERQYDRIANGPISSALLTTMASNSAVAFPQPAQLQLSCFINNPVVSFRFQFKVGTNYNSFIGYRFDEKPGHEIGGHFMASAMTVAIEEPAEVAQFVSELASSDVLYIRIRSFSAGRTTAEFKVAGASAAIASAFATCPVKPPAAAAPPVRHDRMSSR
jgi:hypothetical protein